MTEAHLDPRRYQYTTASQADIICHGTNEQRIQLWRERIGEIPAADLSRNLPVQLGKVLGPWICEWLHFDHPITERERFITHKSLPLSCTLDGYREHDDAVIETKVCLPFKGTREIIVQFTPQVLIQQRCRGASRGVLAVLRGFSLEEFEINVDASYEREVFERMLAFHQCIVTMTPPHALPKQEPLIPPELWRTIDLATVQPTPNWAMPMIQSLNLWRDTKEASELHARSKKDVKEMLPNDVGTLVHHETVVRRSKNGAVTIRTMGEAA